MAETEAGMSAPDLTAFAEAAAAVIRMPVDPAWTQAVVANLKVLRACADLVEGFALPDEAEAAPVFEA